MEPCARAALAEDNANDLALAMTLAKVPAE